MYVFPISAGEIEWQQIIDPNEGEKGEKNKFKKWNKQKAQINDKYIPNISVFKCRVNALVQIQRFSVHQKAF